MLFYNNNKNNKNDNVYGAIIVAMPLWKFTQFMWWIWNGTKRPPTLSPGQMTQAVSLPVGCQKPHPHCHLLLLLSPKADTHFTIPRRIEGWVDLSTAVRVCSPCPRLCILVVFTKNLQLPMVGFEPWSSHTAVRHVTARPLQVCGWLGGVMVRASDLQSSGCGFDSRSAATK